MNRRIARFAASLFVLVLFLVLGACGGEAHKTPMHDQNMPRTHQDTK